MRVYLAAHAAKEHQRQFGWKNFRVLVVTTMTARVGAMLEALRRLRVSHATSAPLFLFTTFNDLRARTPLTVDWLDATRGGVSLINRLCRALLDAVLRRCTVQLVRHPSSYDPSLAGARKPLAPAHAGHRNHSNGDHNGGQQTAQRADASRLFGH